MEYNLIKALIKSTILKYFQEDLKPFILAKLQNKNLKLENFIKVVKKAVVIGAIANFLFLNYYLRHRSTLFLKLLTSLHHYSQSQHSESISKRFLNKKPYYSKDQIIDNSLLL